MPFMTLRANVWDEIGNALDEENDLLYDKIRDAVHASTSWREKITIEVTAGQEQIINQIIEDEDLNIE